MESRWFFVTGSLMSPYVLLNIVEKRYDINGEDFGKIKTVGEAVDLVVHRAG